MSFYGYFNAQIHHFCIREPVFTTFHAYKPSFSGILKAAFAYMTRCRFTAMTPTRMWFIVVIFFPLLN